MSKLNSKDFRCKIFKCLAILLLTLVHNLLIYSNKVETHHSCTLSIKDNKLCEIGTHFFLPSFFDKLLLDH